MAQLAVLTCDGCGEPLAIGEADWVACPGCGKRVVVPEPYRELRDSGRDAAETRVRLEAFYRKLARGPRLLPWLVRRAGKQRGMSILVGLWLAYMAVLIVLPIALLWLLWWLVALAPRVNVYQLLDPAARGLAYGAAIFVALAVPTVGFWALGWKRARRRRMLASALAAGAPAREGGPATCRACGAPLSVPAESSGAACLYCHAENLIVPRDEVIASREKKTLTLEHVVEEEAWQRRKIRRGLVTALLVPTLAGLFAMLAIWFLAGEDYSTVDLGGSLRCAQRECTEWRSHRLRRGQEIRVALDGTASGPARVRLEGMAITPFPRSWITVAEVTPDDSGHARVVAPWDGWFRLVVAVPGPADASFRLR